MADVTPPPQAHLPSVVDWRTFLAEYPPGTRATVEGALHSSDTRPSIAVPELQLYCDGGCRGPSYCVGDVKADGFLFPTHDLVGSRDILLRYVCSKCKITVKSYAVRILGDQQYLATSPMADIAKVGEWPSFSFRTPAKVNSLIGPDRELFFKGRHAESEGLGVGAFAYYRRIVEDQKNRLLEDIIKVARRTSAPADSIAKLEAGKKEIQFHKAMEQVKDAVPPSLLIQGHNPLTLLHSALSRNLHGASDEECLKVAHDIRLVLFELAERLVQALKDEQEINDALSRLVNRKT